MKTSITWHRDKKCQWSCPNRESRRSPLYVYFYLSTEDRLIKCKHSFYYRSSSAKAHQKWADMFDSSYLFLELLVQKVNTYSSLSYIDHIIDTHHMWHMNYQYKEAVLLRRFERIWSEFATIDARGLAVSVGNFRPNWVSCRWCSLLLLYFRCLNISNSLIKSIKKS